MVTMEKVLFVTAQEEKVSLFTGVSPLGLDGEHIELRKGMVIFFLCDYCEKSLIESTKQSLEKLAREKWFTG